MNRLRQVAYSSMLLVIAGWLLVVGKNILIPVVAGAVVVYVFVGLSQQRRRVAWRGHELPLRLRYLLALACIGLVLMAILICLAVWSDLWGFAGAFFAVPITAVIAIICSEFASTRPVAVLLSQNGRR